MAGLNSVFTPLQNLPWEAQLAGMAVIGGWKVANYFADKKAAEAQRTAYQEKFSELMALNQTAPQTSPTGKEWSSTIPVSLFVRTDKAYSVGDVMFDMVVSEDHAKTATVSEHPVEEGAPISDHIQVNLRTLTMKVLVSNYSLSTQKTQGLQTEVINRASRVWSDLTALVEEKKLVEVVTVLEDYRNMAVTSVSAPRKDSTGDALEFDITARQIRKAKLAETVLTGVIKPIDQSTAQRRQAAAKVDVGRQTPQDAKAESVVRDRLGVVISRDVAAAMGTHKGAVNLYQTASGDPTLTPAPLPAFKP